MKDVVGGVEAAVETLSSQSLKAAPPVELLELTELLRPMPPFDKPFESGAP